MQGQDPQFITSLVSRLRMEYYAEGDIVVQEGDLGNVMYFVVSGYLEARQYNLTEIAAFEAGESEEPAVPETDTDSLHEESKGKGIKGYLRQLKKRIGMDSASDR
eukprot:scaffold287130_cov36-Prasinocladus_malaysianus.AAC.1